jgi:sulfonate transport system permease protein
MMLVEVDRTGAVAPQRVAPPGLGRRALFRTLLPWLLPVALLGGWLLATDGLHLLPAHQLPSPRAVLRSARELLLDGELIRHISASVQRVLVGFSLGALAAVMFATWVGLSRTVERLFDPTVQAVRNVPSLAWVPFLLLWLGIDELPKVTLVAIGAFFPVYLNLVAGIRQTDRKLVELGEVLALSGAGMVRYIVLPAALPSLLTGLRIGLGQAWLFLVAAELIASTKGLGFLLIDGQNSARADLMSVGILLLALLGKSSDAALRLVERRLLAWTDGFGGRL